MAQRHSVPHDHSTGAQIIHDSKEFCWFLSDNPALVSAFTTYVQLKDRCATARRAAHNAAARQLWTHMMDLHGRGFSTPACGGARADAHSGMAYDLHLIFVLDEEAVTKVAELAALLAPGVSTGVNIPTAGIKTMTLTLRASINILPRSDQQQSSVVRIICSSESVLHRRRS